MGSRHNNRRIIPMLMLGTEELESFPIDVEETQNY